MLSTSLLLARISSSPGIRQRPRLTTKQCSNAGKLYRDQTERL
jgi:hypothetical protein